MTISQLEQLYLETTSKEDLLAEINDQRRQVVEARGLAIEIERRLWAVEKERDSLASENGTIKKRLNAANNRLAKMYRQYGKPVAAKDMIKNKIAQLIEIGMDNEQISKKGFNPSTVRAIRSQLGMSNKKAAT